jgi:GT2 family glycosyltransferase
VNQPHVAVVVVCWNNRALMESCLRSVDQQDYPTDHLHTYVIDNASTDGSASFVRQQFPAVTVIESDRNEGFAIANNIGIAHARRDHPIRFVVLLNSDATLASNWVSTMVNFALTRPKGAGFQSSTLDGVDTALFDSTHIWVGNDLQARQGHQQQPVRPVATQRVFGVNAAAAMYNVAFVDEQPFAELLDERMWMYLEDVDVSMRALVMGWENWHVAGTTAQHLGSASTKTRTSGFAIRQTCRNQPVLWITHLPWSVMVRRLFAILRHDRGAIRHLRSTGQQEVIGQLIRGRLSGIGLIPYALRRRKALAPHRGLSHDAISVFMSTGTLEP